MSEVRDQDQGGDLMSASMTRTKTPAVGATILSDVADLIMGQSPPSSTYNEAGEGLPFFQGKTDFGFRYPKPRLFCNAPLKIAKPNDILMSVRAPVGPTNLANQECCIGRGLAAIRPRTIDGDFLFFNLRYAEKLIASLGSGSTFHAINKTQLGSVEVNQHDFDLAQQRKIARVLGLVQQAIEQQERLIALTTELKKTLLHKLFTDGLHGEPQKQTDIGPVPMSWEVVPLQDVCSFLSGGTPSKQKPEFWSGSIPWVSPKDMKKARLSNVVDHISEAALEDGSSLAPAESVFVVIRGMILAKDVPVALAEVPMAFNQDMKAIIPGARIMPSFLLYALVAFKQLLFQKVGRSAHGTMTLMSSEIAQFTIPLPDKRTQREVASAIEIIERKHEQHQRKHATLTALFHTLLDQLMTAQIRVHELDLPELGNSIEL
jgi:type I restriction enzyme S subunit